MFDTTKWSMCTPVTDSTVWTSNTWPAWLAPWYRALLLILPTLSLDVLVVRIGVGPVDLALGDPVEGRVREVDDVVAGDRVADRLLPAGEDVDEDQRVRVLGALVAARQTRCPSESR